MSNKTDRKSSSTTFQEDILDTPSAYQSAYSRRPSTTTIPISSGLSSRRASTLVENDSGNENSAYGSPGTKSPLLGRSSRVTLTGGSAARWKQPASWRRKTWGKIVVWLTPTAILLFLLLHHPLRPSQETFSRFRSQMNGILGSSKLQRCPSPFLGRPNGTLEDPSTLSHYHPLASNNTAFSLAIAYSVTTCNSFRIRISRTNPSICLYSHTKPLDLNEDIDTTRFVKENLGPDTFQLRVDGAERYVVDEPSRYDPERCEYYFDFPLANAGTVWLDGIHFYENYDAYNSRPHHFVRRLLNPLFSTPIQLSLCSPSCASYTPPLLSRPHSAFYAVDSVVPKPGRLPACQGLKPIPGVYVPSAYPSLLYPPYQLPQTSERPSAGCHTWIPSRCTFEHDGLRFRNHQTCLEEKNSVLFIGDSHTRGLYDVMLKRLNGSDEMALTSFKVANKRESIGNLDLEFLWDPFLEASFECDYMKQFGHVVVSTGSHQACYRCPSTHDYLGHMYEIFSNWPRKLAKCRKKHGISSSSSKEPTYTFITNPAWYPQVIEEYDCRTQQRLSRWNEFTTSEALKNGWGVVDAFEMTRAIAVDTKKPNMDGVHYIRTDAIDPMVDELIQKMGICGDSRPSKPSTVSWRS